MELGLVNYRTIRFANSNLAASALYLALKMTKNQSPWNDLIVKHSDYREADVRPCAKELFLLLQADAQGNTQLQAVRKKFALPKFSEVSKIKLENHP